MNYYNTIHWNRWGCCIALLVTLILPAICHAEERIWPWEDLTVEGVVRYSDGRPAQGVIVGLVDIAFPEIWIRFKEWGRTDVKGQYNFTCRRRGERNEIQVFKGPDPAQGTHLEDISFSCLSTPKAIDWYHTGPLKVDFDLPSLGGIELLCTDEDGNPLAGAHIKLQKPWSRDQIYRFFYAIGRTNSDGKFVAPEIMPATVTVEVEKQDYQLGDKEKIYPVNPSVMNHATVEMIPDYITEGIVVDSEGKPVAGSFVCASPTGATDSSLGMRTDANGRFTIRRTPWKVFCLSAVYPGFAIWETIGNVTPGSKSNRIQFRPFGKLKGKVVDAIRGNPINEYSMKLKLVRQLYGTHINEFHFKDGKGQFQQGVAPVSYELIVNATGYRPKYLTPVFVGSRKTLNLGKIRLSKIWSLSGRVLSASTHQPVDSAAGIIPSRSELATQNTTPDGRFCFENITSDEVRLTLSPHDEHYLYKKWDRLTSETDLNLGDILLQPADVIRGKINLPSPLFPVRDWTKNDPDYVKNNPVSFIVQMASAKPIIQSASPYSASVDKDGSFALPGKFPDGMYQLIIQEKFYPYGNHMPWITEPFSVIASQAAPPRVDMTQGPVLRGHCKNLTPNSGTFFRICSSYDDRYYGDFYCQSATSEGTFVMRFQKPGVYQVGARMDSDKYDYFRWLEPLTMPASGLSNYVIDLKGIPVKGRVADVIGQKERSRIHVETYSADRKSNETGLRKETSQFCDKNGDFSFTVSREGDYLIYVEDKDQGIEARTRITVPPEGLGGLCLDRPEIRDCGSLSCSVSGVKGKAPSKPYRLNLYDDAGMLRRDIIVENPAAKRGRPILVRNLLAGTYRIEAFRKGTENPDFTGIVKIGPNRTCKISIFLLE